MVAMHLHPWHILVIAEPATLVFKLTVTVSVVDSGVPPSTGKTLVQVKAAPTLATDFEAPDSEAFGDEPKEPALCGIGLLPMLSVMPFVMLVGRHRRDTGRVHL